MKQNIQITFTSGEEPMYYHTNHFIKRTTQRGIPVPIVALALEFGEEFMEGDRSVFFLGRKQMPRNLDAQIASQADGTVVVVGSDLTLITTYKNPLFLRELKRRHA